MTRTLTIPGSFVSLALPGKARDLDGFWAHKPTRSRTLVVFVHGMGGNFFRSPFKKECMRQGLSNGIDVLSCHNSGALGDVVNERFSHCLRDLDAMIAFGTQQGYKRFILVGHSTGCQKITYWQAKRKDTRVVGMILAAPADDLALAKKQLGRRFDHWVARARQLVADKQGDTLLPEKCNGFTARRFLSIADPKQAEAATFDYEGRMRAFRAVTTPTYALFGSTEQFAVLDVDEMGRRLKDRTAATPFRYDTIADGDHGFTGVEAPTVRRIYRWIKANTNGVVR